MACNSDTPKVDQTMPNKSSHAAAFHGACCMGSAWKNGQMITLPYFAIVTCGENGICDGAIYSPLHSF